MGCPAWSYATHKLDTWLWQRIVDTLNHPEVITERLSVLKQADPTAGQVESIEARLAEIEEQVSRVTDDLLVLKSTIARASLQQRLEALGQEHDTLTELLEERKRERAGWEQAQRFEASISVSQITVPCHVCQWASWASLPTNQERQFMHWT